MQNWVNLHTVIILRLHVNKDTKVKQILLTLDFIQQIGKIMILFEIKLTQITNLAIKGLVLIYSYK